MDIYDKVKHCPHISTLAQDMLIELIENGRVEFVNEILNLANNYQSLIEESAGEDI